MLSPMPILDRRRFLFTTAAAAAATSLRARAQAKPATLTIHTDKPGPTVPANFIGLSYEIQQLSEPAFFSAANHGLIAQFRALAPHGVLRLGGNTSDIGFWTPNPDPAKPNAFPPLPSNVVLNTNPGPGEKSPLALAYQVTPLAVRNLRAFLDATGWTCLYGINLGTNTPERAADEAAFVSTALGAKLEYFQIGNEPDMLERRFRNPKTWSADHYFDDWLALANAIRARVPKAKFGIPDTANRPDWYAVVVTRLLATPNPPEVACLTHHYYFNGPPSNPDVNINKLLHHDTRVDHLATDITTAAQRLGTGQHRTVPYRMSEGNTCYRGGKPGVSDVFASALWSADYLLQLASLGYCGVNLHGGSGKMVADSLGGTLPGELLMPDPHAPHARPFYTPIDVEANKYTAEPVSFGMRFAANFAGTTMHPIDFAPGALNATAYAATLATGQPIVAIINKDSSPLPLDLPGYALALILSAPSIDSKQVSLTEPTANRELSTVPPFTAVLLRSTRP
jgi:hypothetical protein